MNRAEESIGFSVLVAIRRIIRRTSEHSRRISRESGLSIPQMLCLKAIGEASAEEGVTVAGVAQRVHLSVATVSRILDRLERAGSIERIRGSSDRRRVYISLTEPGRAQFASLPTPLHEEFLARLGALKQSEQKHLLEALERIVELMDATTLDASPVLTDELDVGGEA